MKACCNSIRSGRLEFVNLPEPVVYEPDDVKIKVHYATFGHEEVRPASINSFYHREGIFGVEMAGEIVDLGKQAQLQGFSIGDYVTGLPFHFCGVCKSCRSGRPNCCINPAFAGGTMSEYIIWKSSQLVRLSPKTPLREGCLLASVAEALEVMERAHISVKTSVAIWGGNYMALLLAKLAKRYGALEVTIIDDVPARISMELMMGADHVFNPNDPSFSLNMHNVTNFSGFDVILECSGLSRNLNASLEYLSRGGTIVLTTTYEKPISMNMDPSVVYVGNYTIISVFTSSIKLDTAERLAHELSLNNLISREYPFSSVPKALQDYDYKTDYKIAIRMI